MPRPPLQLLIGQTKSRSKKSSTAAAFDWADISWLDESGAHAARANGATRAARLVISCMREGQRGGSREATDRVDIGLTRT
jgi:hypothetical protein